ncbi:hypothetical protein [Streptomyces aquilus]|nr:hypothetical protein [Streptomyces aquilus]
MSSTRSGNASAALPGFDAGATPAAELRDVRACFGGGDKPRQGTGSGRNH